MRELWRANPSKPEPEPVPVVEEPAQVEPRAIAEQVWSAGTKPRSRFFELQNEAAQAETEQALNHAVDSNWVAVSGDQIES